MKHSLHWFIVLWGAVGGDLVGSHQVASAQAVDEGCPETSAPQTHTGTTLQRFATDSNAGIVFDNSVSKLKLAKAGGLFRATNFTISSKVVGICAGDFDEDGWVDFIGASDGGYDLAFYRNITFENQQPPNIPDWDNPNYRTTPKFANAYYLEQNCQGRNGHAAPAVCSPGGGLAIACADFNQDGHQDFFYARSTSLSSNVTASRTNRADIFLGRGDGTFERRYQAITPLSSLDYLSWSVDSTPYDYNGDSFPDLVIGHSLSNTRSAVHVFLSDGSSQPKLTQANALVSGSELGKRGALASVFGDLTGDGYPDLVTSGPTEPDVWIYDGLPGGGVTSTRRKITSSFRGGATTIVSADFALNGKPDLIIASDNWNYRYDSIGGYSAYWKNNGTSTPFADGITQETTTRYNPYYDFDVGAVFDYDHDPSGTPDVIIADGNHAAGYMVLANRTINQYTECGTVDSGILDLGSLADEEMVVTSAKLTPNMSVPSGTKVTFFMSNSEPADWYEAAVCVDDSAAYCVSFPRPVGRTVRWKAEMCSNTYRTTTPSISDVRVTYDYTVAKEHYRAGVVVDDGIAYVGAFRQPGARGHFYASNAGLSTTYWDFAEKLDAMNDSDRRIYTAQNGGVGRLDFHPNNANNPKLQLVLGVANADQAEAVINWQRSRRFGIGRSSRLGSIENSTPAVVRPPQLPVWYPHSDAKTKRKVDEFIEAQKHRKTVVLFGSKDGAIHAVRSEATNMADPSNGTEAWAFIPARVAREFLADFTNDEATAYPDGSPTVADVILSDGEVHTVAIVSGGNGHRGIVALDVTETVSSTGVTIGPTPLWHALPGGASAGQALSKPVIARVFVGGVETYYAIMATGRASENPNAPYTKGREVIAVDINDGSIAWQFQSKCAVTSDIMVFETDDELEVNSPKIDGYMDRAVWADACGNVYKVDPAQSVGGNYIASLGSISTGHTDPRGQRISALFSTADSACAIGGERPIAGTLGGRPDTSGRFAIFFGTGGIESFDPNLRNAFYAIYADTGEVRGCAGGNPQQGRILGSCATGTCEKFYGGVVVTAENIIATRATDPLVGTGTCDLGSSNVSAFSMVDFAERFAVSTNSATVSPLYGDGGAVYLATLGGEIVRIGTPRATDAGGDSANQDNPQQAPDDATGDAMGILGWRILQ